MMENVAKRIEKLREDSGMSLTEMAEALEMSFPGYRDLESHDDEITMCVDFGKALELARMLKTDLLSLLEGSTRDSVVETMSLEMLRDFVQQKLYSKAISKEALSWQIDPFLTMPEAAFEQPINFLIDLAADAGFDWRAVVAYYDANPSTAKVLTGMRIRPYHSPDEDLVIDLWKRCGLVRPQNDPKKDIARKMKVNPELFLVGIFKGAVVATAMAGYDGHRGWINYLAVAPEHRRSGFGRQIMDEAERRLMALGCPKINLQVRTDNKEVIAFYESLGFVMDDVVSLGKRLVVDEPER